MATASQAALRAGYDLSAKLASQVDATFRDTAGVEKLSLWALKVHGPALPGPVPPHQLYLRFPRSSQR